MPDPALSDWLLDSDPALRWQVERDLLGLPESIWGATRARVALEGFGARLLALQDPDGQWAGGAYFPAGFDFEGPEAADGAGQPWTATTWTLNSLREWGVDAAVLTDTAARLAANSRWEYDELPYWGGEVDCCINAWTLMNGLWLGADVERIATWFVEHRLDDGGWNCAWVEGSTRSSFHSTLNSLKGLLAHEMATGGSDATRAARLAGEAYLLERRLMFRRSSGELVAPWVTRLAYPFRWFYSVLNAADHFRAASLFESTSPDPRLADAIEAIRAQRQPDGTWIQARRHPGRVWFEIDVPAGEPSRWLTFFATRVLDWWDASARPWTGRTGSMVVSTRPVEPYTRAAGGWAEDEGGEPMATDAYASEGDLHAVLGRALIDTAFRDRLLDEAQQKAALEEMGITPSGEVVDALNKAIDALTDLSSTFGAKRAAT